MPASPTISPSHHRISQNTPTSVPHTGETRRILELDGLRGMAALLVVYCHLFLTWVPSDTFITFWLRNLSGLSWTGVNLFFILSGFLIARILLANHSSPNYYPAFFKRRALRILPLYYLLVSACLLFPALTPAAADNAATTLHPWWSYLSLTQNFFMSLHAEWGAPSLSITWSVALEEQFYIFLPFLLRAVPRRHLGKMVALMMMIGPLSRLLLPVAYPPFLCIGAFDSLFLGTALAVLEQDNPSALKQASSRAIGMLGFAVGGAGMILGMARYNLGALAHSYIALFWGSVIFLVISYAGTPWTAPFRNRILMWVGSISYGVYLLHPVMREIVENTLGPIVILSPGLAMATATLLLTLLSAQVSFTFIESRLIAYGRRFQY